jgi:putative acyl-CoA dehydrogenase
MIPADEKMSGGAGLTVGMAMTEKQGGSDVRANATVATALGGLEYSLTGHKWFCSAPMSDGFLTLAQASGGLSCFFVPRWRPDGARNGIRIQRLKDKLGNHANASSEIEYVDAWAHRVGEEGRGVRTIIEMVNHTRLDASLANAGLMRQALSQALNHCAHRSAFGARLINQPLMRAVLADLTVESEAATQMTMRVARAFDTYHRTGDQQEGAFARLAVAVTKFWICKRTPDMVVEALECHGGAGYVEESPMPRLYREAPLNGIWEGSGNVMCLDVLRALQREPEAAQAFMQVTAQARGFHPALDAHLSTLAGALGSLSTLSSEQVQLKARSLTSDLAVALQGALLALYSPPALARAFCDSRVASGRRLYGDWGDADVDVNALLSRVEPILG